MFFLLWTICLAELTEYLELGWDFPEHGEYKSKACLGGLDGHTIVETQCNSNGNGKL